MTDIEKEGMAQLEKGEEEIDELAQQMNGKVDELLDGIDNVKDSLKEQEGLIHNVEVKVDELTGELLTESVKLKKTLSKWKSAGSAGIMVALIIILCLCIGA